MRVRYYYIGYILFDMIKFVVSERDDTLSKSTYVTRSGLDTPISLNVSGNSLILPTPNLMGVG